MHLGKSLGSTFAPCCFSLPRPAISQANQRDPFYQRLLGEAYEKLGEKDKAMECYCKAAATMVHNPPVAFARKKSGD
jgi:hypothetical protein